MQKKITKPVAKVTKPVAKITKPIAKVTKPVAKVATSAAKNKWVQRGALVALTATTTVAAMKAAPKIKKALSSAKKVNTFSNPISTKPLNTLKKATVSKAMSFVKKPSAPAEPEEEEQSLDNMAVKSAPIPEQKIQEASLETTPWGNTPRVSDSMPDQKTEAEESEETPESKKDAAAKNDDKSKKESGIGLPLIIALAVGGLLVLRK